MAKIDLEAIHKIEQALIGVIVQQNDVLDRMRIDDTMLISIKAKLAFRAAKKMRDEQREFDAIVLADVEPKIGLDWITQAYIDASKAMVDEYVDRIRAFQRSKRLLESLDEIKATLSKDGFDAAMDAYARTLRDLETGSDEPSVSIIKAMSMASTRIAENAGKRYGFPTGIESLDAIIGGFAPGIPTIIGARPGAGKAQPLDAKVLTPRGWTLMGQLKVGDQVIGADGKPCKIVAIHEQGKIDCFRVTMSDGASTTCCGDHLWLTRTRKDRKSNKDGTVKSTKEIMATFRVNADDRLNHSIPYTAPVCFAKQTELEIDPYLLGLYLGDGHSASSVVFTNPEHDVRMEFARRLPKKDCCVFVDGMHMRVKRKIVERDSRGKVIPSEFMQTIRRMGLAGLRSHEKFVPDNFLLASVDDRIALLQGMLDSDGYVSQARSIEYSTTSESLMRAVYFLVGSLGGVVSSREITGAYKKNGKRVACKKAWRMWVRFPMGNVSPVRSRKHLAKWSGGAQRMSERFISDIVGIGKKSARCITVDNSTGLYVTDDFIVTHNSSTALAIAKANALAGNGVHVFTLEDSTETYAQRLMALESRTPTNLLRVGRINTAQQAGITKAFGKYAGVNWRIDESNADKPEEIVRRVRMQASQNKTKIVIIDFLQIVAHSMREPSEHQALTRCMNEFARAAKRDNMAYVIMSQLNRQVEERQDKRPTRSDFRGSGSIEEYAKVMIGLYRGSYYHDEPIEGIDYPNGGHKPTQQEFREQIHLLVLKNNNGPVGNTMAKWKGEFCEITD